ncbi:MAG: hypothetical protein ACXVEE_42590 [Polyangiales bacterium]
MRRFAFLFAPAMLLACSSSNEPAPAGTDSGTTVTDTGSSTTDSSTTTDTGTAVTDSASMETSFSTACGMAPYVKWSGTFTLQGLSGAMPPTGVKITSPGCPGATFTTAADGSYTLDVQKGLTSYIRVTADGAIPAIVGESLADADTSGINLVLLPAIFKGFLSDWASGQPAILVKVSADPAATGTCKDPSGVTISVKDQPTAKVAYFNNSTPPSVMAGATSTSASGIVAITGITGTSVELIGTKTGCTASPKVSPLTGKTAIEADYLTEAAMSLAN